MMFEQCSSGRMRISREAPGKICSAQIRFSYGPMEIGVQVAGEAETVRESCEAVPRIARSLLEYVKTFQPLLRMKAQELTVKPRWPRVVRKMIGAVQTVSEETLTPMAAVAGAISDELLLNLREAAGNGLVRILVNNGGDMALFSPREPVRTGIRGAAISGHSMREMIVSPVDVPYGVATSGWRGRSFSQGIADAVVVVAPSGAVADAAATHIGNCVMNDTIDEVEQCKASELDPMTDIPDLQVTVSCGRLTEGKKKKALKNGRDMAQLLMDRGIIWGAGIYLQGREMEAAKSDGIKFRDIVKSEKYVS